MSTPTATARQRVAAGSASGTRLTTAARPRTAPRDGARGDRRGDVDAVIEGDAGGDVVAAEDRAMISSMAMLSQRGIGLLCNATQLMGIAQSHDLFCTVAPSPSPLPGIGEREKTPLPLGGRGLG